MLPAGAAGRARPAARKPRASRAALRGAAWAAAGAAVAAPAVMLTAAPNPASSATPAGHRQVILIHRTVRRIVIDPATIGGATSSAPRIHYVYVGGGTVSAGGSATTTRCSHC